MLRIDGDSVVAVVDSELNVGDDEDARKCGGVTVGTCVWTTRAVHRRVDSHKGRVPTQCRGPADDVLNKKNSRDFTAAKSKGPARMSSWPRINRGNEHCNAA